MSRKVFDQDLIIPEMREPRVSITDRREIMFGPFSLSRHDRTLIREGVLLSVGGRAFDVLAMLAAAEGETVGKDMLLDHVWPGLSVEENSLQVQISALRKVLGEGWINTVPGRGYRLVMPRVSARPAPKEEDFNGKPSIAVLAFANLSDKIEQEYFADGVAHDLITELARNRLLFVIARNSSFSYKGRSVDVKSIARDLGVRYVVEGGVRRDGNSIRITAQLIDAENGSHIWAERFDRELGDLFAVQDEITRSIVAAIDPLIAQTERQRAMRKAPESLNVWEAWQRALWFWAKGGDLSVPRDFLQRAVALDPGFAPAHAMLALLHLSDAALGSDLPLRDNVMQAEAKARTAIDLDPDSAIAHAVLAWVFNFQGDSKTALEEAGIAINLDPNDPQGHVIKGRILTLSGQTAAAREPLAIALRLDPRGPTAPTVMVHRTMCCYLERDYLAAVATARRAIRSYPGFSRLHAWLAAALGQLDRIDEAREMLNTVTAASPSYFKFITSSMPPFYRPEDHEHLLAGLRRAGWQG